MRPRPPPRMQNAADPRMFDIYRTTAEKRPFAATCREVMRDRLPSRTRRSAYQPGRPGVPSAYSTPKPCERWRPGRTVARFRSHLSVGPTISSTSSSSSSCSTPSPTLTGNAASPSSVVPTNSPNASGTYSGSAASSLIASATGTVDFTAVLPSTLPDRPPRSHQERTSRRDHRHRKLLRAPGTTFVARLQWSPPERKPGARTARAERRRGGVRRFASRFART
jgi:hypothetical protein